MSRGVARCRAAPKTSVFTVARCRAVRQALQPGRASEWCVCVIQAASSKHVLMRQPTSDAHDCEGTGTLHMAGHVQGTARLLYSHTVVNQKLAFRSAHYLKAPSVKPLCDHVESCHHQSCRIRIRHNLETSLNYCQFPRVVIRRTAFSYSGYVPQLFSMIRFHAESGSCKETSLSVVARSGDVI